MSFLKNHRNIVAVTGTGGDDVANTQHHFIQLEHILKCLKILHECLEEPTANGGHTNGAGLQQRPLVPMPPTRRLKRQGLFLDNFIVLFWVTPPLHDNVTDNHSLPRLLSDFSSFGVGTYII